MNPTRLVLSLSIALAGLATSAQAQTLNLEFGPAGSGVEAGFVSRNASGSIPVGTGNTFANAISLTLTPFQNRTGTAGTLAERSRGAVVDSGAFTNADLYDDFVRSDTGSSPVLRIALGGLAANSPYQFTIYSYDALGGSNNTNTMDFVRTGSATPFGQVTYQGRSFGSQIAPTTNNQFSVTTILTSDANGTLSVDARYVSSIGSSPEVKAVVNGIQLVAVPEPSTALIAMMANIPMLMLRRRRK